jgi:hypothetical protein
MPFPNALLLGFAGRKSVHVVFADNLDENVRLSSLFMNLIQLFGVMI